MSRYEDHQYWSEIGKQQIFEAWVPHVANRPMGFFVPFNDGQDIELLQREPYITKPIEGMVTNQIQDNSIFSEHLVVNKLKRRRVVILTGTEWCVDETYPVVNVAKIVSIKPDRKGTKWHQTVVNGDHPFFVHLPEEITGVESYINMAQVTTIGKKLLITKYGQMRADIMRSIEKTYNKIVDLGIILPDHKVITEDDDIAG